MPRPSRSERLFRRSFLFRFFLSCQVAVEEAAQEQAAAALANLARDSEENRTSIVQAGGIPPLLSLLNSSSAQAKENTVTAITQLAYRSRENQASVAAAGGIGIKVADGRVPRTATAATWSIPQQQVVALLGAFVAPAASAPVDEPS